MREYPVLDPVSQAYPEVEGRSPTCYSPVRRSCTPKGLTARLACVKHAASVRPEPGSNSPTKTVRREKPTLLTKTSYSKKPPTHKVRGQSTQNVSTLLSSQRTTTRIASRPSGRPHHPVPSVVHPTRPAGGQPFQPIRPPGPGATPPPWRHGEHYRARRAGFEGGIDRGVGAGRAASGPVGPPSSGRDELDTRRRALPATHDQPATVEQVGLGRRPVLGLDLGVVHVGPALGHGAPGSATAGGQPG